MIKYRNKIVYLFIIILLLILVGCNKNQHIHEYINGVCSCGDLEVIKYKVTFVDYDGTILKEEYVLKNSSATAPTPPARDCYTFIGWSESFNNVNKELIVIAQYQIINVSTMYKVVFDDGNGKILDEVTVEKGNKIEKPENPVREGYKFIGWYYKDELWNFVGYSVTENMVIVAKWETIYSVKFDTGTECKIDEIKVESGKLVSQPDYPVREGYYFSGWYYQNELWDFSDSIVTENIVLIAKWEPRQYFIEYQNLENSKNNNPRYYTIESETIVLNSPVHQYYEFLGWTYEGQDEPIKEVKIDSGSSSNKIFKANWLKVKLQLVDENYQVIGLLDYNDESIVIPNKYNDIEITSIGDYAFDNTSELHANHNLKTIVMPDCITSIGDYAFCYCDNLSNIVLSNSLMNIGDYAFLGCTSLKDLKIPNGVVNIGVNSFKVCNLQNFSVDENNKNYKSINGDLYSKDGKTFIQCITKKQDGFFDVPSFVTRIDSNAFAYCLDLINVNVPNSVINIGSYAFAGCENLENINIPINVTSIEDSVFEYCFDLINVELPNGITNIGSRAFLACDSLTSIVIPESVVIIENYAFYVSSALTIYCEAVSQPSTWDKYWNYADHPVVWGYKSN